jgi:membrane protease YdiL (CAAX protease family)
MTPESDSDTAEPRQAYVPRTGWTAASAVVAIVAIFLIALAAASLATIGLVSRTGPAGPSAPSEKLLLVSILVMQVVVVALTLLAAGLKGSSVLETLALRHPARGWRQLVTGFAGLVAVVTLINAVGKAVAPGDMERDLQPFIGIARSDLWWLCLLAVGIGAPLSEELTFRGFLFSALAKTRLGAVGTSIVTSAAWTAMHAGYSPAGITEVFLIGLYFSYLLVRTGSLWVPILCHGLYNSALLAFIALAPIAPAAG